MTTSSSLEALERLLELDETEHLEFKAAKSQFNVEKLTNYCCALANEGGGALLLGVSDAKPHRVVGTSAFPDLNLVVNKVLPQLRLRIRVEEVLHPDGRVLVITVPSRPIGFPLQTNGTYWMRAGESLVAMTNDQLQAIFQEAGHDFSAEFCRGLQMADLEPEAIDRFRKRWLENGAPESLERVSDEKLLSAAELMDEDGISYAALILFGTGRALGRYLADAEVIYEYRSGEAEIRHQDRVEYRQGLFLFFDLLLTKIDARNDKQFFLDGPYRREIPTFNGGAVREVLLNAICHRDYRQAGSIFVRQFPRRLEVVSPGGFPPGVTVENILHKQAPRNRRLAEAFARCALVERSGQGLDIIYRECLKETKPLPNFARSDKYQVSISLDSHVQDPKFVLFLEKLAEETRQTFSLEDLQVINAVYQGQPVPEEAREQLPALVDLGVLEQIGRGRGQRHVLSQRFYSFLGKPGTYTRTVGLDRETNKALLLKHIETSQGVQLAELTEVVPALSRSQLQSMLRELKEDGLVRHEGHTRGAKWFATASSPGPSALDEDEQ